MSPMTGKQSWGQLQGIVYIIITITLKFAYYYYYCNYWLAPS